MDRDERKNFLERKKKEIILSLLLVFLVFIFRIVPSEIPYLDRKGDEYFETATKKALVAYGTIRVLNAVVSVAKETEVEVTPFGVGLTIHLGQFLDPVDDATERLSSVLTASIAALGLMKIIKELLQIYTFKLVSYLILFLLPGLWIKRLRNFSRIVLNIVILLFAVRLALPVCGVVNDFLYKDYFEPEINKALLVFRSIREYEQKFSPQNFSVNSLGINSAENYDNAEDYENYQENEYQNEDEGSIWNSLKKKISGFNPINKLDSLKETISSMWDVTKEKTQEIKDFLIHIWQKKGEIVGALSKLIVLEVSMVVIQVILLPFTVIWILTKLINVLFERKLTVEELVEVLNTRKYREEMK